MCQERTIEYFTICASCWKLGMQLENDKGMRLPGMVGYPASKLLNVIHARELAKRLKGNEIDDTRIAGMKIPFCCMIYQFVFLTKKQR